ncbi:agmatinase [Cohaesibacter gelatinilyticus]|uniref:Agmatinase n=1 Tax=Cohaesibacter gelatinilyticus TaxID=372072 RepID=A0A285NBR1_9HYPH|nr:agmatinase [Cohaesibacter gelatinilyticus]SNZ06728.1 agmatinase [Cohaesibacter gelatinilyticus]
MIETQSEIAGNTNEDPIIHDEYGEADLAITRRSPYGTLAEATYAGILSFMRRQYSKDLDGADVAVFGVPFDISVSNRPGCRFGPRAIRQASSMLAWDRAWGWEFDPFERLAVVDYGDLQFDPGYPRQIADRLQEQIKEMVDREVATLMLGGDHFCTYPAIKAHAEKHGPMALIQFDAHSDTWRDNGKRLDHGTMFYHAAQEGVILPEKSAQIGIRTNNPESHGFNIFSADWVRENGVEATIKAVREAVGDHPAYVTFDIDGLDPAFAPGTGTPVVGGMHTGDVRAIIRGLQGLNIKAMDVVEVSPAYDVGEVTALAAATLALDLICLYASQFPDRKAKAML